MDERGTGMDAVSTYPAEGRDSIKLALRLRDQIQRGVAISG